MRLLVFLLLWSGAAAAQARAWDFAEGTQGWCAGWAPVEWALADSGTNQLEAPSVRAGALAIAGRTVERYFLDAGGFVRRGAAREEWLLSPEIGDSAVHCRSIRVRLRDGRAGEVLVQVQWVTRTSARALSEIGRSLRRLIPPDSVQAAMASYRGGSLTRSGYEQFMERWQNGSGRPYVTEWSRLQQQTAALQGLCQTQERLVALSAGVSEVVIDLQELPGWDGELQRIGLRLAERPSVADIVTPAGPQAQPFVEVLGVALMP